MTIMTQTYAIYVCKRENPFTVDFLFRLVTDARQKYRQNRQFNYEWTSKFFVREVHNRPVCLIRCKINLQMLQNIITQTTKILIVDFCLTQKDDEDS